jgi:Ras-related GTP-binding protein A/B
MKKMLLMGSEGAGKTSMHRVIFAGLPAKDTANIGYTTSKEEHKITLMGDLVLDLWDCGSQDEFMREYFHSRR